MNYLEQHAEHHLEGLGELPEETKALIKAAFLAGGKAGVLVSKSAALCHFGTAGLEIHTWATNPVGMAVCREIDKAVERKRG